MTDMIEIDKGELLKHLMELCKKPGPTQACVKVSEKDPRIDGEFPMERAINDIVGRISNNGIGKLDLHVIPHMGNLVIVGGLGRVHTPPKKKEIEKIRKIPVIFGAHLDEITYILSKELRDYRHLPGEVWKVLPLCNPPKKLKEQTDSHPIIIYDDNKNDDKPKTITGVIGEINWSKSQIVGFRSRSFREDIGKGILYKLYKVKEEFSITEDKGEVYISQKVGKLLNDHENRIAELEQASQGKTANMEKEIPINEIDRMDRQEFLNDEDNLEKYLTVEKHLLLKVESSNEAIREGDCLIQDPSMLHYRPESDILESKALDDRVGCIAAIYAVKELAAKGIPAKAILTSSEEGVPLDVSWGRLARSTYKEYCSDDVVSLVCDGMDGSKLYTIVRPRASGPVTEDLRGKQELQEAVIIPYTAEGKGGGDASLFSLLRDEVVPKLNKLYPQEIAVTSTEYSGRSYEVRIMDRWTLIGFVQWTCGIPTESISICHNKESVKVAQVVNIARTLAHSAAYLRYLRTGETNRLLFEVVSQ